MGTEMVKANGNGTPQAGMTVRQEFGAEQTTIHSDMRSAALAAQETAQIQARYIVAMQRPRDFMNVRTRVLAHCERPFFAKCARYAKPMGKEKNEDTGEWVPKFVCGPSIRFVETALREMGNIAQDVVVIVDDHQRRIVRVSVTDIETNTSSSAEIMIEKTVERSSAKDGRIPISTRKNSYGRDVYLLPATEDEIATKQNAAVSKALRTLGLRVIPGDLVEESMDRVISVQNNEDAKDPTATRRALADYFAKRGVMPEDLAQYLGHTIEKLTPAELAELRAIGQAINDSETTWAAVMASKFGGDEKSESTQPRATTLKEKLKAQPAQAAAQPPADRPSDPAASEGPPPSPQPRRQMRQPGED